MKQAQTLLHSLSEKLRAACRDEKRRVNLLLAAGLGGMLLLLVSEWFPEEAAAPEPAPQPAEELPFQPGAGLYDEPAAEKPARKTARKSSAGKRSTRKPKASAEPQEELSSPAFDNFEGVDFDS